MIEQLELKTIPLPDEIKISLGDYPEEVQDALTQEFSAEYTAKFENGFTISHDSFEGLDAIILENEDLNILFDVRISYTEDGNEIRELNRISNQEIETIAVFLIDWNKESIIQIREVD